MKNLSATIDSLYAAVYSPRKWPEALRRVEDFTGCDGAMLSLLSTQPGGADVAISGRFSLDECTAFAREFMRICPRIGFGEAHPERHCTYDALIMSEAEMDADPVYKWWSGLGLRYHLGAMLPGSDNHRCNIGLQRARTRGHAAPDDLRIFGLLAPHLKRSVQMMHDIGSMRSNWQFSQIVLHGIPQGILVVNRRGRVIFVNQAAEAMLAGTDALCLKEGRLAAKRNRDAVELDRVLTDALALGAGESVRAGRWVSIPRPTTSLPYSVFVAPLCGDATAIEGEEPGALVVIHDLARRRTVGEGVLGKLFGLTRKEASVATAIGRGYDLASVASMLEMAPATARVHLGAIYRKLDIGRQQELVGLVHSLVPLCDA